MSLTIRQLNRPRKVEWPIPTHGGGAGSPPEGPQSPAAEAPSNRKRALAPYGSHWGEDDGKYTLKAQLSEQRFRLFEIRRIEPFGKGAIDRCEQIDCLLSFTLLTQEPRKIPRAAKLER